MRFTVDGRGRWYRWDAKPTVDGCTLLDIGALARATSLDRETWLSWRWTWTHGRSDSIGITIRPGYGVQLRYRLGTGEDIRDDIAIAYTVPNYGGRRPWWVCPGCGRRVRHLYGRRVYRCRECHGLTYQIRRERGPDAIATAARNRRRRVAKRLGATLDPASLPTGKPPRMQWRTYYALLWEYKTLAQMEDYARIAGVAPLVGMDIPAADVADMWRYARRRSPMAGTFAPRRYRPAVPRPPVPLAALAQLAGVPADVARDAVRARLLRPDAGRGGGVGLYRPRLAGWLRKLHALRSAGMAWADIRAWSRRRWQPGREHERRWPEGYAQGGGEGGHDGA